jgi:hypothetical protein
MFEIVELTPDNYVRTFIFDLIPQIELKHTSSITRECISILLSKCTPKLNKNIVLNELFPVLLNLCNDIQYDVRASACRGLVGVGEMFGPDLTMDIVIPEVYKLLCDESSVVRTASFETLIQLLPLFEGNLLIKNRKTIEN